MYAAQPGLNGSNSSAGELVTPGVSTVASVSGIKKKRNHVCPIFSKVKVIIQLIFLFNGVLLRSKALSVYACLFGWVTNFYILLKLYVNTTEIILTLCPLPTALWP
jgi:hypothetical protein